MALLLVSVVVCLVCCLHSAGAITGCTACTELKSLEELYCNELTNFVLKVEIVNETYWKNPISEDFSEYRYGFEFVETYRLNDLTNPGATLHQAILWFRHPTYCPTRLEVGKTYIIMGTYMFSVKNYNYMDYFYAAMGCSGVHIDVDNEPEEARRVEEIAQAQGQC